MKSLVDTGLVKSIKLKNNIFILKTLDNRKIKFTKLLDTLDEVNRFKKNCHSSSFIIMNKLNSNDTNCVTILEKDVFYNERYHSFLVHNNMVNDYARNILISFDDYMFLFEPNVIYNENSEIVLRNIIELNSSDMEFRKTEYCYLLKYAINKQIYSK